MEYQNDIGIIKETYMLERKKMAVVLRGQGGFTW